MRMCSVDFGFIANRQTDRHGEQYCFIICSGNTLFHFLYCIRVLRYLVILAPLPGLVSSSVQSTSKTEVCMELSENILPFTERRARQNRASSTSFTNIVSSDCNIIEHHCHHLMSWATQLHFLVYIAIVDVTVCIQWNKSEKKTVY